MDFFISEEKIQDEYEALCKEEDEVDKQLEKLLSKKTGLDGKIRDIAKAIPNLDIVNSDAKQLAEMVAVTSKLAENVSAKVRQLDIARGRVSECQQRVHDLLDLQLCSDGVQAALRAEDYEKAAVHVHRFLSMDQHLLKQTADDMAQDCQTVANSLRLLREAASKLRDIVSEQFQAAVSVNDLASIERFFKIFPMLGMHAYGLDNFSKYLCSKIKDNSSTKLRAALSVKESEKHFCIVFADCITSLFEYVAHTLEIHQPLIETYYGFGYLVKMMEHLQEECDRQSKLVLNEFSRVRNLSRRIQTVKELLRGVSNPKLDRIDPKDLDALLNEITAIHSRYQLYSRFVKRRIVADLEAAGKTEDEAISVLSDNDLCKSMQELIGQYILLEHYYMEESVRKAVSMDVLDNGAMTSSMIDDIFFIVRKCIRRAGSSSSIDGVCAVVNFAVTVLETQLCSAIKQVLKQGFPSGYLDLTQAYTVVMQGRLQQSDSEQTKLTFLTYLNNGEQSTEYVNTLVKGLCEEVQCYTEQERAKLDSCLAGLSAVTASLGAVADYGMQQLQVSAIKPRVGPWVDTFLTMNHQLSEDEFASYEANEPFVRNLIMNLETLLSEFKNRLLPNNYDSLITILAVEVSSQIEKVILKTTFNRLGALALDKEIRALVSYLSKATTWSIRDKFARLTQILTVLNLEKVSEITDYWGSLSWRLTPAEVRQFMGLRIEFKSDEIKRLKLQ
nr:PREDICTED: conserved oligomeric Golgi complex subunit 4 [Bemisia tabaci]